MQGWYRNEIGGWRGGTGRIREENMNGARFSRRQLQKCYKKLKWPRITVAGENGTGKSLIEHSDPEIAEDPEARRTQSG